MLTGDGQQIARRDGEEGRKPTPPIRALTVTFVSRSRQMHLTKALASFTTDSWQRSFVDLERNLSDLGQAPDPAPNFSLRELVLGPSAWSPVTISPALL